MKLVILDHHALNPGDMDLSEFRSFGEVIVYPRSKPEEVVERIGDAEMIFINKVIIDRKVMDACPNLRYVGVMATGYNVVDIEAAREHGIVVTNIPDYSTESVAQFTFALILARANRVFEHSASVHAGEWITSPDFSYWKYPLIDLRDKTLGIFGFGAIGQRVAKIALAMGMRVMYYTRTHHPELDTPECRYADVDTVLSQADIVTLHLPLSKDNAGMVCKDWIAKMKDGAWLINTARGGLIREEDLAEALRSGKLGYAASDVVSVEPMEADNPLLTAPNMTITPHIAWASFEARERLMKIAADNIRAYLVKAPINDVTRV